MSYALSGTTPSPIPSSNSTAARSFIVGETAYGFLTFGVPWLDASLEVRGVSSAQAPTAPGIVRQALVSADGEVSDARWTEGGRLYVRWRPRTAQPAVAYATTVARIIASSSARSFGSGVTILLPRYRVNMPPLREDIYVYPDTAPGAAMIGATSATAPEKVGAAESPPARNYEAMVIAGAVGGTAMLVVVAGLVLSRVRRAVVRPNRRRRRS